MDNQGRREYDIEARQVEYDGQLFRSVLELRWVYFFEAMRWKYEYEKEVFSLGDSIGYLPDFYLTHMGVWAEVKPTKFTPAELEKCRRLVLKTGRECLLLAGLPHEDKFWMFVPDPDAPDKVTGVRLVLAVLPYVYPYPEILHTQAGLMKRFGELEYVRMQECRLACATASKRLLGELRTMRTLGDEMTRYFEGK